VNAQHHVLIVTQNSVRGGNLGSWLASEGYSVTCVNTFAAARLHLQMKPGVVITELKLGAYNGLHLAVRANATRIPVVVLGERDAFFEREARQLGTTYIAYDEATRERIVSYVDTTIRSASTSDASQVSWIGKSAIAALRQESSARASLVRFPSSGRRLDLN
jgi:DNA-binding response OmpR family regulator